MATQILSVERLRELLAYDPETGFLTWKIKRRRVNVGDIAGCVTSDGYIRLKVEGRHLFAHRVAWIMQTGEWPIAEVDHRNGIRNDNRWENLRSADRALNMQNQRRAQRSNKSSGFLGVAYHGAGKWQSRIRLGDKRLYLGSFSTPTEAHAAYLIAKERLHAGYLKYPFPTPIGDKR